MIAPEGEVGRRIPRLEVGEKVSGAAAYIADMSRPGELHGAILQSPYPHARILGYDISRALASPGVRAVVTGDDCPDGYMGAFIKDEHAIAKGKVRYVGEPVAAVAADTEAQARAACALIDVNYQELPTVLDPTDALRADAPIIHEAVESYVKVFDAGSIGNLCARTSYSEGDLDAAWRQCDVILEAKFETQPQAHVALEPCGALADVDLSGRVSLWSANQSVFRVQANVCESLLLPMSRVRSMTPHVGGGFGNKMEPHIQPIAVMLALKSGRPVKLILSREEDFEMVRARHPLRMRIKTGATREGILIAREVEVLLDGGAYADDSPGVLSNCLRMSGGAYRFQAMKAHGVVVYTNKLRFGAFRGFGQPQVQFGCEQQIDEIAEELNIDPIELRCRNIKTTADRWFGGQFIRSIGQAECLRKVESESGWRDRSLLPQRNGKRRAMGVASSVHISGLSATGAIVRMLEDGTILLNTGATDIGQGSDTTLTQICAGALKIDVDRVRLAKPDTDGSPYNWGTTASRVTYMTGRSVAAAANDVARQAKEHASEMLECATADVELRPGGIIGVVGVPGKQVTLTDVARRSHWIKGGPIVASHSWVYDQKTIDPKRCLAIGNPSLAAGAFSYGAIIVDVEVDEITGKVEVLRAWTAVDPGRAINPLAVEGQAEGAFVQGMGFALTEEMVWDGPRLANPSLMDYKILTTRDAPYAIHSYIIESMEPDGPFGARGCGEIGINVVAAAIANAVKAATGVRFRVLPLTPQRVLFGMLEQDQAQ